MENSEKYLVNEGVFDWLLKTLVGKDRAAKMKYYKAIAGDRKLTKLSKELEAQVEKIKQSAQAFKKRPGWDQDHLQRLRRGI